MLVSDAEAKAAKLLEQAESLVWQDAGRTALFTQLAFAYIALAECLKD